MGKIKIQITEYQKIINLYQNNTSATQIAKIYNVHTETITKILKKSGIVLRDNIRSNRKYSINDHYFDQIDTEHKAYWLGLLFADGCVQKIGESYHIKLELKSTDIDLIFKFKNDLNAGAPVRTYKQKTTLPNGSICEGEYSLLEICSPEIGEKLISYGCVPRKSNILKFPDISIFKSKNLIRHFIRGYFDGDGSVFISKEKHWRSGKISDVIHYRFIGTPDFCKELQNQINLGGCIYIAKKYKNTVELNYKRNKKLIPFFEFLYKDATIWLLRKYNIFKNHIDNLERGSETIIS